MDKITLKPYSAPEIVPQDVVKFLKKRKYNKIKKKTYLINPTNYRMETLPNINQYDDIMEENSY